MEVQINDLSGAVRATLDQFPPDPRDRAAAALALTYVSEIEMGGDLTKLGPSLLAALEALQLTPRARAIAEKGKRNDASTGPRSRLDELRERRARKDAS